MTRSKVKVTRPLKLEILQFSKSISSGIFNVNWQMTTDSETMEHYLNFVRTRFSISVIVFVSRDYELGTKFRLIVVYLLRKNHRKRFPLLATFRQIQEVWTVNIRGVDRQSHTGLIFCFLVVWVYFVLVLLILPLPINCLNGKYHLTGRAHRSLKW